ncbi:unnamed protein product [Cuscuta epithymum]|uniref:Zinc knuckle CX2CX4HX4C domain-containing protein n=1 Tax=Cuscuta epithymum TaxID=186058 RepID=A0AAV0CDU1_9ASTE|nr:unnamed protein product [Cuscuta epithymum]
MEAGKGILIKEVGEKDKPLKKGTNLKKEGKSYWVDFKYEKLPNFCFICGLIGHSDKFCPLNYEEDIVLEKKIGIQLRAGSGVKTNPTGGRKWLLEGSSSSGRDRRYVRDIKSDGRQDGGGKESISELAQSITKGVRAETKEEILGEQKRRRIWEAQGKTRLERISCLWMGQKTGKVRASTSRSA